MEKILRRLMEYGLEGVDTYTHNGSTWLIFTDNKQWVIELTDNKTLWYNYNFFKQLFCVATNDVVSKQHHITKWVEDNIINKESSYVTLFRDARDRKQQFKDTIENGIKMTSSLESRDYTGDIDDVLEKGVNETLSGSYLNVDSVIQDGVKRTDNWLGRDISVIEDTLKNGVKNTKMAYMKTDWSINDTIENGVMEVYNYGGSRKSSVGDVIQDGVKETKNAKGAYIEDVDEVIKEGVKETNYDTDKYTDDVKEVIREGVKSSTPRQYVGENIIDKIINKSVKEIKSWSESIDGNLNQYGCVDAVINEGVKETKPSGYSPMDKIGKVVNEGIKIKNLTD
jgi:tartrate dehydratase alpha subunit/fumarate hydratase class I-like protein